MTKNFILFIGTIFLLIMAINSYGGSIKQTKNENKEGYVEYSIVEDVFKISDLKSDQNTIQFCNKHSILCIKTYTLYVNCNTQTYKKEKGTISLKDKPNAIIGINESEKSENIFKQICKNTKN